MRHWPDPELELLALSARLEVDPERAQRILELSGRNPDWNAVVQMARRHGVVAFVYRTLKHLNAGRAEPEHLAKLRGLAEAIRFQNLVLTDTLIEIVRDLEAAGVRVVPYKGPALAQHLFGDLGLRQSVDIDLLVEPRRALRARDVLLRRGYRSNRAMADRMAATFARFHCGFTFTTARDVLVELNWRITPWYWRYPELPAEAWTRLVRLPLAGTRVHWFAPEDLLLVLVLHGSKHRWEMLKWLVDIAELLRVHPDLDWERLWDDARRCGCARMVALGLLLSNELLDAPLPAKTLDFIRAVPRVHSLATEVRGELLDRCARPAGTLGELPFVSRVAERYETKFACQALRPFYFALHHLIRPGVAALRQVSRP